MSASAVPAIRSEGSMASNTSIPAPVIAAASVALYERYTHTGLDNLFMHANAPGDPPVGNKLEKCQAWLRRASKEPDVAGLAVVGRAIEEFMEADRALDESQEEDRARIRDALAKSGLAYHAGGVVAAVGAASPTRSLEEIVRGRDLPSVDGEFRRAMRSIETAPEEAVSAASNTLESICKIYIEDHDHLEMPKKKDLPAVWGVVRRDLRFDPSAIEDDDLKRILSGLLSVVDGLGALRTHASSAHGTGRAGYRLRPRHARLAVHAAHTLAVFIIESWDESGPAD